MDDAEPRACRNCAAPLHGPWCSECGQHEVTARLDTRDLLHQAVSSLVGLDAALPRTIRDLTLRPGPMVREYVAGRRRRYVNPAQYFLFAVALLVLAFTVRHVRPSDMALVQNDAQDPPEVQDVVVELKHLLDTHMQFLIFSSIPFFALTARVLQARAGFTFAESCALFLYALAHGSFLGSIPHLLIGAGTPATSIALAAAGFAYYAWAVRGFYESTWSRAIATVLVGYLAWILMICVVIAILIITVFVVTLR